MAAVDETRPEEDGDAGPVRDRDDRRAEARRIVDQVPALLERLRASEALAQRGLLAASLGHELNNAMTAVLGNLECLHAELDRLDTPGLASAKEVLTDSIEASRNAVLLARDLHSGLAPTSEGPSRIDLRSVVRAAVRMARTRLQHKATVRESYATDVPQVFASPRAMTQVVLNLLFNALEALPADGEANHSIGVEVGVDAEGRAVISVSDSGRGMDETTRTHIFEPFFTRRDAGDGTGLGLYLSRRLVNEAGGMIEVESALDRGTVFFVTFPAADLGGERAAAGVD